eukprot:g57536.t1
MGSEEKWQSGSFAFVLHDQQLCQLVPYAFTDKNVEPFVTWTSSVANLSPTRRAPKHHLNNMSEPEETSADSEESGVELKEPVESNSEQAEQAQAMTPAVPPELVQLDGLEQPLHFLHAAVDRLCGRDVPLPALPANDADSEALSRAVASFFTAAVGQQLSGEAVGALLSSAAIPTSAKACKAILTCLDARGPELQRALKDKTQALSQEVLQDFDWSLRLTMASEKLATLRAPALILSLMLTSAGGEERQVQVEVGKDELDRLLESLEQAHKVLRQLPAGQDPS